MAAHALVGRPGWRAPESALRRAFSVLAAALIALVVSSRARRWPARTALAARAAASPTGFVLGSFVSLPSSSPGLFTGSSSTGEKRNDLRLRFRKRAALVASVASAGAALTTLLTSLAMASPVPETGIGLPRDVSEEGHRIDWLIKTTMGFVVLLFAIMCIWIALAIKNHGESHAAEYDHGDAGIRSASPPAFRR